MDAASALRAPDQKHTLPRWVSCPNPFYLLSAACVLHATGWQAHGQGLPPGLIPLMVAAYIALLALTATCIVRWWQVWDDARTILVTLFLLFLELALSLDQFAIAQPQHGVPALLAGWCFSAGIVEALLRGLRMRLPGLYRRSLHLQLALMFGYPVLLVPGARLGDNLQTTNLLAAYAGAVAVPLLMLWPAVRRGSASAENNGTPWQWPLYPWTVPVVMSACLVARSFSLCLTFDGAPLLTADAAYRSWQSIWGGEFAAPTVLAWAVLVLEAGLVTGRKLARWCGLLLPVIAAGIVGVGMPPNPAREAFLQHVISGGLSPMWMTLLACAAFYGMAMIRHVPGAWRGLAATAMALVCMPPLATSPREWSAPAAWMWLVLGGAVVLGGLLRRRTLWNLEGATYLVFGTWVAGAFVVSPAVPDAAVALNVWLAALVLVSIALDDDLARLLRQIALQLLMVALFAGALYSLPIRQPWWLGPFYLLILSGLSRFVWWTHRAVEYRTLSRVAALAAYAAGYWQGSAELWRTSHWGGLPSFAIGLALLHLGVVVSALKGGFWRQNYGVAVPNEPSTT